MINYNIPQIIQISPPIPRALGIAGSIIVLILAIFGVGTGGYFLVRKKRK